MAANIRPRKWTPVERMADWWDDAACFGQDPSPWYPEIGDPASEEALVICGNCPVKDECLAYAVATNEQDGVWGGLTVTQRRTLRRTTHRRIA